MPRTLKLGIAGGIWAIIGGIVFLMLALVTSMVWWVPAVLISIILMGIISEVAIKLRTRNPRLALTLIWVSIASIIIAAWGDPFTWGITVSLPAAILLIPVAIKMRRGIVKTQG